MKTETAAGRGRRWLWAIMPLLFVIGVVVSTTMVHSERNRALDGVVERAGDEAQSVMAILTGKQLTRPVTGSSYDKLAAKISRFVSSKGSVVDVTVWSSRGKVLFSLNESSVGNAPEEMRSLIAGIAQGSGSARVLDDTVQTFTPVSRSIDGPVAVVEIDQPIAVVDAQIGALWNTLRLGSAFGLAASFLLLGLTFVWSRSLVRAPADERHDEDDGAEMAAERQPEEAPAGAPTPASDEDLEALHPHLDQAVEEVVTPEGDLDSQVWTQWHEDLQAAAIENGFESQPSIQEWHEESQDPSLEGDLEPHWSVRQRNEESRDMSLESELEAEIEVQKSMRQWREEFKARAKQAELRLKKPDAELDEAPSAPSSEK